MERLNGDRIADQPLHKGLRVAAQDASGADAVDRPVQEEPAVAGPDRAAGIEAFHRLIGADMLQNGQIGQLLVVQIELPGMVETVEGVHNGDVLQDATR